MDASDTTGRLATARAALCRPVPAAVVLLAVYVVLSLGMSPEGYLGTDTGAKVATLEVMVREGSWRPDLGYWAEEWDPEGQVHPIHDTRRNDGDWVHVTTLPMLLVARPLYDLGGYRLTLVLPMLGAVGTAFAARSIARRIAGDRTGWQAYWVAGLASPIAVYALDLWEHAPGVACVTGAVALLAGAIDGDRLGWRAGGAGLLLGAAATMRTEAFVYSFTAVGFCCLALLVADRRLGRAVRAGALAVAGFAIPWLANRALEGWLGGLSRTERASRTATTGLERFDDRVREVVTTLLAIRGDDVGSVLLFGGSLAVVLVLAVVASRRRERHVVLVLLGLAGVLHLAALSGGFGFVPGMVAAAPLVVVGVLRAGGGTTSRYVAAVALGSLPLVWAFQFVGGALPQWAGRYALASCLLLVTLGVAALPTEAREIRVGFLVLSAAVTATGVLWLGERSRGIEHLFDELVERPEDVVIARNGFLVREGGASYVERRWLSAVSEDDVRHAVRVAGDAGLGTAAFLDESPDAPAEIDGATLVGSESIRTLGVTFYLHTYRLPEA